MAHPPPASSQQRSRRRSQSPQAKRSSWQQHLWQWSGKGLAIVGITGGLLAATAAVRVGYQLVVNPGAVPWVSERFPDWQPPDYRQQQAKTWQVVQAGLKAQGQRAGEPLRLVPTATEQNLPGAALPTTADWVVPIFAPQPHCTADCDRLVALHVYRPLTETGIVLQPGDRLYPVAQMALPQLSSTTVLTPLHQATAVNLGRDRPLRLSTVAVLPGQGPDFAHWLVVSHPFTLAGHELKYGLVIPYSVVEAGFLSPLPWVSLTNQLPQWQPVNPPTTAVGQAETETAELAADTLSAHAWPDLIVDHTVGLEPKLQLHRWVAPLDWAIAGGFQTVDLNPVIQQGDYQAALTLAQAGLWSLALARWQQIPSALLAGERGSEPAANPAIAPTLAAQQQLVALQAQRTQAQATQKWASPSQKILAQLIDGQWHTARQTLLATPAQPGMQTAIQAMLRQQEPQLRQRLNTALTVRAQDPDAQVWLALLTALTRNETQAIANLQHSSSSPQTTTAWLHQALAHLQGDVINPPLLTANATAAPRAVATDSPSNVHDGRWIGVARPITRVNPDQWPVYAAETPPPATHWVEIEVQHRHDGEQWRSQPLGSVPTAAAAAWDWLQLSPQAPVQLWQAGDRLRAAQLQAIRQEGGRLYLLASGADAAIAAPALALAPEALAWPMATPPQALHELHAKTPDRGDRLLQALWQTLRQGEYMVDLPAESRDRLLSQFGNSRVQPVDTGQPSDIRWIIWLRGAQLRQSAYATHRPGQLHPEADYVIVTTDTGEVIYTNLTQPDEQVRAIAQRDQRPFLVLETPTSYRLVALSP